MTPPFDLDERSARKLRQILPSLDKTAVRSLMMLYSEPFDSKEAREYPFNLRKKKPRTLIWHLAEMLSLAKNAFPPPKPPRAPPRDWKKRIMAKYPDLVLPDDFWLLRPNMQQDIRDELKADDEDSPKQPPEGSY